jgi:hypothetical protein
MKTSFIVQAPGVNGCYAAKCFYKSISHKIKNTNQKLMLKLNEETLHVS